MPGVALLKGVRNGARLFVVDPRRTSSAEWADGWLGLDIGTDIPLANAVAREIIHAGLVNETFVDRATTGFAELAAAVEPWTLAAVERETGVPAEAIRALAHAYARADRAQLCWTLGITEHHNATDNVRALINLSLLTGHVGRYGSGLNPLRGQNNVQGGGDMGAIPNRMPGFQDILDPEVRARFGAAYGREIQPRHGMHLTQMLEAMDRRELAARIGDRTGGRRPGATAGTGVHDPALPGRGRHQHPDHRGHRPDRRHRRVQGDGDPRREGPRDERRVIGNRPLPRSGTVAYGKLHTVSPPL
ncbi:hypothetical protein GCM10027176_40550 [Actinoallomurus bryophytorum]|uniref:Molybdopterin-dependent oxidoreductase-like protein n=1 Tax=Actinoallomurus bryophytorum TaxID=1490222 RepID=A0A543CW49_9ACTN|nr:molybdopterin-dependent oxidoreductase-like protein [Actinoallomurus bryophytorum]